MMGLTQRQADCLAAIKAHIEAHGASPSYTQLQAALGVGSKSNITRLLHGLKQRGHIDFIPRAARSIVLRASPLEWGLSPDLAARLAAHCAETGDDLAAVIHDAVDLYLDQVDASVDQLGAVDDAEALAIAGVALDPPPPQPSPASGGGSEEGGAP